MVAVGSLLNVVSPIAAACAVNCAGTAMDANEHQGYKPATRILFDSSTIHMKWKSVMPIGAGLQNMGNTCFVNSVLQCLVYTPPLANILLLAKHSASCTVIGRSPLQVLSQAGIVSSVHIHAHIHLIHHLV